MKEKKHLILDVVDDLVYNFLYYDRKEDEDLPLGAIEEAVGVDLTIDDIIQHFEKKLHEGLE